VNPSANLFGNPGEIEVRDCQVRRTRSYSMVCQLVDLWHSTRPNPPAGFRVAFLIFAPNQEPVAVATWGRPEARMEDQVTTLELTRLAHSPYAPHNLGTYTLGRMRRWIRTNMPEVVRLISYQDADAHDGALYKADNWRKVYEKKARHSWKNRPGRIGSEVEHRIKWEREP